VCVRVCRVELHEYANLDAVGLGELLYAREVTAAE
jgi:hypothetical protein